jgi:hypothetical protein
MGIPLRTEWAALAALALGACGGQNTGRDASVVDAGASAVDGGDESRDSGTPVLYDGGTIIYGGGCVSPDNNKVIFELDSREPQWCAYISMRRWDGGFTPLFPNFDPPEDFKVDDARWDLCRDLELPTRLNPNSFPVEELSGVFRFRFVFEGRAQDFDFDGGIQMGNFGFASVLFGGLSNTCKGN